jgi:hypothetical protein
MVIAVGSDRFRTAFESDTIDTTALRKAAEKAGYFTNRWNDHKEFEINPELTVWIPEDEDKRYDYLDRVVYGTAIAKVTVEELKDIVREMFMDRM